MGSFAIEGVAENSADVQLDVSRRDDGPNFKTMTSRVPLLHGSNELLGVPWRSFTFDEQVEGTKGTQKTSLFVKSVFWSNPGAYAVMATDLVSLWMENVPKDTLKERFDCRSACRVSRKRVGPSLVSALRLILRHRSQLATFGAFSPLLGKILQISLGNEWRSNMKTRHIT